MGTWVLLQVVWLHPWLSTDFRCASFRLPVVISLNGVIEEEGVLVEVVLGLLGLHSFRERECLSGRLSVLDLVVVFVLGAWGVLSNVLGFGELVVEHFAAIPPVGLSETVLSGSGLNRKGQFSERSVRLLRVQSLG